MSGAPFLTDQEVAELTGRVAEASRRLAPAIHDMAETGRRFSVVMAKEHRRILRAAYRSRLLPWPIPRSSCRYPHRARWTGQAPQRRRRRR